MQMSPPPPIDPDVFDDHKYFFDWDSYRAEKPKVERDSVWTEERISELRRLWDEGVYAKDIGERMGCSKSAILGKASRLGFPQRCCKTDFKPRNARKSSGKFVKVDA